jgi:CRISPR system Cascade subunit CasA
MEFNLVDEKWIPCLIAGEKTSQEFSLRETLLQAHEIDEIFDNSPLITISLHRLLLAILHRNFGPASFSEWKKFWNQNQKRWGEEVIKVINDYLDEWKPRFKLFDAEKPFYQVAEIKNKKGEVADLKTVTIMSQELASGNNATLFDHNFEQLGKNFSFSETARYLITTQAFALPGGVSFPFNFSLANSTKGITFLAKGDNLFQTLALNLVLYNEEMPFPISSNAEDLPIWEQKNLAQPDAKGTDAKGYLDYLTWQSRKVVIEKPVIEEVAKCVVQQNLVLSKTHAVLDPLKCYVVDKTEGITPLKFNSEKSLWRDTQALFQQIKVDSRKKKSLSLTSFLARVEQARKSGEIEAKSQYDLIAYGLVTKDKAANVVSWSRERLPLPMIYTTGEGKVLVDRLKDSLNLAENIGEILRNSIWFLSKLLLSPMSDDANARQPDSKDVRKVSETFGAEGIYWSRLESPFKNLLVNLPKDKSFDEDGDEVFGKEELKIWARTVDKIAMQAFEIAINGLSGSARELKAIAEAEGVFHSRMKKLRNENPQLFENKNGGKNE